MGKVRSITGFLRVSKSCYERQRSGVVCHVGRNVDIVGLIGGCSESESPDPFDASTSTSGCLRHILLKRLAPTFATLLQRRRIYILRKNAVGNPAAFEGPLSKGTGTFNSCCASSTEDAFDEAF